MSVIIPVYNSEKYIRRCLDSLVNQSYENIEIIIVNDGSTDASGEICNAYAEKDLRIRVIYQENGGQGGARNTGINVVRGEYISFVDSDDYVSRNMYEIIIDVFMEQRADIVCFDLHKGKEEAFIFKTGRGSIDVYEGIEFLRKLYKINNFDSSVLKVYRKSLFDEIRFPPGRTMGEDVGTVYRLVYEAKRVAKIDEEIYYYFQSSGSTMRGKFSPVKAKEFISFKERLLFFEDIGEVELYERALLQYEAVILRGYFYIKRSYPDETRLISDYKSELSYIKKNIRKIKTISKIKKVIYLMAAGAPQISGFVVSRLI